MKTQKLQILAFLSSLLLAATAHAEPSKKSFTPARQTAAAKNPCEQKIRALIIKTAKAMGQKQDFGFQLDHESEGKDINGRPLVSYNATVFIIPEGYISNSAARAIVRTPETTCEVIKLAVSIGG